jgi:chromosome segregation ATPase
MRTEELQEEVSQRETHIIKLKDEVKKVQGAMNALNRKMVEKDKDIERLRAEQKEAIRWGRTSLCLCLYF